MQHLISDRAATDRPVMAVGDRMSEPTDRRAGAAVESNESSTLANTFRSRHLLILAIVVVVGRLLFSANRSVFDLSPDEPAIFGMARWMSGSTPWNMFNHNTWQPGMSILMTPLFWMTDRPDVIYHGGLVINATLGGVGGGACWRASHCGSPRCRRRQRSWPVERLR